MSIITIITTTMERMSAAAMSTITIMKSMSTIMTMRMRTNAAAMTTTMIMTMKNTSTTITTTRAKSAAMSITMSTRSMSTIMITGTSIITTTTRTKNAAAAIITIIMDMMPMRSLIPGAGKMYLPCQKNSLRIYLRDSPRAMNTARSSVQRAWWPLRMRREPGITLISFPENMRSGTESPSTQARSA